MLVSKRVAMGEEKTARKGIAEVNQMGNIEPTTICYAVAQVRMFPPKSRRLKLTTLDRHGWALVTWNSGRKPTTA